MVVVVVMAVMVVAAVVTVIMPELTMTMAGGYRRAQNTHHRAARDKE